MMARDFSSDGWSFDESSNPIFYGLGHDDLSLGLVEKSQDTKQKTANENETENKSTPPPDPKPFFPPLSPDRSSQRSVFPFEQFGNWDSHSLPASSSPSSPSASSLDKAEEPIQRPNYRKGGIMDGLRAQNMTPRVGPLPSENEAFGIFLWKLSNVYYPTRSLLPSSSR